VSSVRRRVTIVGPGARGSVRASYQLDPDEKVFIGEIHALLKSGSSEVELAEHLRSIEADEMELRVSPIEKLRTVADSLRRLELPNVRPSKEQST
jgi:hypothetical protein